MFLIQFFRLTKKEKIISKNAINFSFDEIDSLNFSKKNIYFIVDGRFTGKILKIPMLL